MDAERRRTSQSTAPIRMSAGILIMSSQRTTTCAHTHAHTHTRTHTEREREIERERLREDKRVSAFPLQYIFLVFPQATSPYSLFFFSFFPELFPLFERIFMRALCRAQKLCISAKLERHKLSSTQVISYLQTPASCPPCPASSAAAPPCALPKPA